jgi:hypothetical protein
MDPKIEMSDVYEPSADIVAREIEGEIIIVPIASGIGDLEDELYTVNATGRLIWARLDGKKDLRTIAAEIAAEHESSPGEIEEDVAGFVGELLTRRIVVKGGGK